MSEPIEYVNVMLEGRMPTLRHELKHLSAKPRKLKTKDGQIYEVVYFSGHDTMIAGCAKGPHHGSVVRVFSANSPAKAETLLGGALQHQEGAWVNTLAFTNTKVFNQPRMQTLVQSLGRGSRVGMVVEDEPEKITLKHLEKWLRDWIPAFRSNNETRRNLHPPYFAIRQRLSDAVSGRLDASKIAALYGLSTAEMGKICGVSKQAIHANPTSKGIQDRLQPLAQAARGLLRFRNDEASFKAWLNQPNEDFPVYQGRRPSPLDLIKMGHAQVIADKIQNLLTGHPS